MVYELKFSSIQIILSFFFLFICYINFLGSFHLDNHLIGVLFDCLNNLFSLLQVAVFASGVDTSATETKGTVLIHSAEQVYLEEVLSGVAIVSVFHQSS